MEWMKLLACASHDYMKLMVFELQQKLIELEAIENQRKKCLQPPKTSIVSSKSANSLSSQQLPKMQLSISSDSVKSLTSQTNLRQNPFNVTEVENGVEVLTRTQVNLWSKYHASIGQKIKSDQQKWHQKYIASNPLVDIG